MNGWALWVVLTGVGLSLLAVLVGRYNSRRRFLRGRARLTAEEIAKSAQVPIDPARAWKLLVTIGDAYSVEPALLRLEDSLKDLAKLDSWDLGSGQDRLERWLHDNGVTSLAGARTIGDLIARIAARPAE